MKAINPSNGQLIRTYTDHGPEEVALRLEKAEEAQRFWSRLSFGERAERMFQVAELLADKKETLAVLMANEMGKPVREGRGEIEKCAWVCRYYAEHAQAFLQDEPIETDAARSYVAYRPLGLVLAIMPWNFPFWQVFRFAAPGLMAGNGGLLKHSPNVPGCALAIEELFAQADFPSGLFATLLVEVDAVDGLLEDPRVAAATLTGSVRAGRSVASKAGGQIKKTVLELGGSDAYVVLEDADLEAAAESCVRSRLINSGQSCIAAKRFVVVQQVRAAFEELVVERMRRVRVGPPLDEETDVGPLAREDLRENIHRQVVASVELGAGVAIGGELPDGPGYFYPPTLLTDVRSGMPAHDEELFGPVASLIEVADETEAIEVANDTRFGLGAAVFTRDLERAERIAAQELEAGSCFVNAFVKSDPRLPFGGIKESGYGRELARHGIHEFVNAKTVYVA